MASEKFQQSSGFLDWLNNYSLRTKLIFGMIGVVALAVGGLGIAINNVIQTTLENQVGATLNNQAVAQSISVGNDLAKQVELLKILGLSEKLSTAMENANASYAGDQQAIRAEIDQIDQQWVTAIGNNNDLDPLIQKILSSSEKNELIAFQNEHPAHIEMFITDKYGALISSTDRTSDYNQADESWWQSAYNNGTGSVYFGTPEYDESTQAFASSIAVPILLNESNEVIGILRTTYNISGLVQLLTNERFAETGAASLLFPNGEILNSNGERSVLDTTTITRLQSLQSGFTQMQYQGKQLLISPRNISSTSLEKNAVESLGWILILEQDPEEAFRPVRVVGQTTLIISLLAFIIAASIAAFGAQLLSNPIIKLTNIAEQIRSGNLDIRAPANGKDEISKLSSAFNEMTDQLQETLKGLENRVLERTAELGKVNERNQHQAIQLRAIAEITRSIANLKNLDELLPEICQRISNAFGFYHVGIFLIDDNHEYAVLKATNSEGGQRMLDRKHRLKVNQIGIVGFVTGTGMPRIALDVGDDAIFFTNPDLPETRSELALPLSLGDEVIGALDVQSTVPAAFSTQDIDTLGLLSDQISIAIQNARLFEDTSIALSEAQNIYTQSALTSWQDINRQSSIVGFRYANGITESLSQNTHLATASANNNETLPIPIKFRGQTLGSLNIRIPGRTQTWNESEVRLYQAIVERLSFALENARLYVDAQKRAAKERVIGDIGAKISASVSLDNILQTAIEELGRTLPGSEVIIQFENETDD